MKTFESIIFTKPFIFRGKEITITNTIILIVRFPCYQNIFICVVHSYQFHCFAFYPKIRKQSQ